MSDYYDMEKRTQGIKERFEEQKNCRLTPIDHSTTPGKEFHTLLAWGGSGQKKINFSTAYCNGKLYYLEQGYVFESNVDGSEQRILIRVKDFFKTANENTIYSTKIFMEVNQTGIYLQHYEKKFTVFWFTLEGNHKKTIQLNGKIIKPYIHGKRIYHVLVKAATKENLCYVDIETEAITTIMETSKVLEFCGDMEKVVWKAVFEKTKQGVSVSGTGWYMLEFKNNECVCLTSENAQPHRIYKFTDEFIEDSPKYVPDKKSISIRAVDIIRNIMWVSIPYKEVAENGVKTQEYWEAMELRQEGEPVKDAPIWRISPSQLSSGKNGYDIKDASYFDGNNFLNGRALTTMKSYDVEGNCVEYGTRTNSGACNKFRVLSGYVYADFEQAGFEQYSIDNGKMEYVRDCWFAREHVFMGKQMPPLNIDAYIEEYKNRK